MNPGSARAAARRASEACRSSAARVLSTPSGTRLAAMSAAVRISERVEGRARWVLETLGAGHLRLARDLPFRPEAWDQVDRGELPQGDDLAAAFFHLARIVAEEREHGSRSTFFVMAGHGHRADGAAPGSYDRLRPKLVETLAEAGAEVGLHGSYLAAEDFERLARERALLAQLDGPLVGHRYHYLRVDPHRNLVPLEDLGFRYDTSLGFPDALGFRAGIAHPFRVWDLECDRPSDLVEVPLAVMDATLAEERYEGLSAAAARPRVLAVLDWAAGH